MVAFERVVVVTSKCRLVRVSGETWASSAASCILIKEFECADGSACSFVASPGGQGRAASLPAPPLVVGGGGPTAELHAELRRPRHRCYLTKPRAGPASPRALSNFLLCRRGAQARRVTLAVLTPRHLFNRCLGTERHRATIVEIDPTIQINARLPLRFPGPRRWHGCPWPDACSVTADGRWPHLLDDDWCDAESIHAPLRAPHLDARAS